MGILDILGFSKGIDSQYKEIHKIISTYYQNELPKNRDDYIKSRNAKETAERELFSLVGKDEREQRESDCILHRLQRPDRKARVDVRDLGPQR